MQTLFKLLDALLAALLLAMVAMVFGNVVLRYAFNSGLVVSEELSRFCFVWLTFLGAIVAMREHAHLGMDGFVRRLPRTGGQHCTSNGRAARPRTGLPPGADCHGHVDHLVIG